MLNMTLNMQIKNIGNIVPSVAKHSYKSNG
jgi:hypothetical protein